MLMNDSKDPAPDQNRTGRPVGESLLPHGSTESSLSNLNELSESPDQTLKIADPPPGVGLLVLSKQHTVLHTNAEAAALLQRLRLLQTRHEASTECAPRLPATVQYVCDEVDRTLIDRSEHNDWLPFEVSRTVGDAREAIMVRAFVFPSRASLSQTRILITLHTLFRQSRASL